MKQVGSVAVAFVMAVMLIKPVYAAPVFLNLMTSEILGETELKEGELYAKGAVLMDAKSGRVLYSKNGREVMPMASTTKILTCILALENSSPEDTITASAYAAGMPKVKLYMKEGEHYLLKDLLYSLMLESHNDTAVAIAEHIGGSVEGFAQMMNAKAKEIGCESSFFLTPNGLDATVKATGQFHSTTAEDLAKIMAYCVTKSEKKDAFLKITQTSGYTFTNQEGRSFSCHNHNAFLNMMEGAISGKTGFTNRAGYCYVGALERDGRVFTVALLACGWPNHKTYKWSDTKKMMSYGIDNFHYKDVFKPITLPDLIVEDGIPEDNSPFHEAKVSLTLAEQEPLSLLLKESDCVTVETQLKRQIKAPVEKGRVAGQVVYKLNDEVVKSYPVLVTERIGKISYKWMLSYIARQYFL